MRSRGGTFSILLLTERSSAEYLSCTAYRSRRLATAESSTQGEGKETRSRRPNDTLSAGIAYGQGPKESAFGTRTVTYTAGMPSDHPPELSPRDRAGTGDWTVDTDSGHRHWTGLARVPGQWTKTLDTDAGQGWHG